MKGFPVKLLLQLLLLQACFLTGCKDKDDDGLNPEVHTLDIKPINSTSVLLQGRLVQKGKSPVQDYGFVYGSSQSLDVNWGNVVSLGTSAQAGPFTKQMDIDILARYLVDRTLYVRAFVTNDKGTVYGQINSIKLPTYTVQNIEPTSGKAGDLITINGQNFTSNKEKVEVLFGMTPAAVVEASETKIVVRVPDNIQYDLNTFMAQLRLSINGAETVAQPYFQVIPTYKTFAPVQGGIGSLIEIKGENLPFSFWNGTLLKVFFGKAESFIEFGSNTSIRVMVPIYVDAEEVQITILDPKGNTTVLPGTFKVTPHTLTAVSPAAGLPGSTFSIHGSGFASTNNYYSGPAHRVYIGETQAHFNVVSATELSVTVPGDVVFGEQTVRVQQGPHLLEVPQKFTVTEPVIRSFSPAIGGPNQEVIILGDFLPGFTYEVFFGNYTTTAAAYLKDRLYVNVPWNATPGTVRIAVKLGTITMVASNNFTVVTPAITTFAPASGAPGTEVVITCIGFTPHSGTIVRFGSVYSSIKSFTANTIRATVPTNVAPGSMKINISQLGINVTSTDNFTVTN